MKSKKYRIYLLVITIVLFLMAAGSEILYFSDFEYILRTRRFNKILAEKETVFDNSLNSLKLSLDSGEDISQVVKENPFSVIENQGTILFYFDKKLVHWSDNSFDVPRNWDDSLFSKSLVFIQNGWFLTKSVKGGNGIIVALLRLRNDYGFENNLVRNGFVKEFGVPESTGFSLSKNISDFNVFSKEGKRLFSLVFPPGRQESYLIALPVILYAAAFVLLLLLILEAAAFFNSRRNNLAGVSISFFVLFLIYFLFLVFRKPLVFQETELFSPYRFTLNGFLPSLGHLFLLSILATIFANIFYRYFPMKSLSQEKPVISYFILTILMFSTLILLGIINYIFQQLVSGSNINFEPYKVLELSVYSLIGFFSIILLFLVEILFMLKVVKIGENLKIQTVILSVLTSFILFSLIIVYVPGKVFHLSVFWIVLITALWFGNKRKMTKLNMSVVFSLLFGVYSLYYLLVLSEKKNIENIKVLAVTYSNENDPEAEQLLINLWPVVSKDSVLKSMLSAELKTPDQNDKISQYLHETYFGGYWGNFKLFIVTCDNTSPLNIGPENNMVPSCFDYFNERIKKFGHRLTGTDFYYLEDQGGRSCYVGRLFYSLPGNKTNGLFVELRSTADAFEAGYSELLLDKTYRGYSKLKDYSFAKYINGNLVLRTGEFPYDKTDAEYIDKNSDYRTFERESFKHVLYKNGNVTVIVSKPKLTAFDVLISFAYIFAFILLISNLLLTIMKRPDLRTFISFNFRQKLQLAFIGILLFSFIAIGIVVSFFSIRQYQTKHLENIKEKVNSVYTELDSRLSMERNLTPDWRDDNNSSLEELLIKLSNVFNTDINLYDKNGYLIATSRREVFNRDLTSRRLNMVALINLDDLTKSEYIQREKIGSLEYISAYVPFYNGENQLLAYLNLPYFRMQSVLAREISNIVVAIINFMMLLIVITMSIAVFISGRLTSPLRMLSSGLASVELGKKSEHLTYNGHDEIGDLVKQYNSMVDEIEESANKLTNSEREYAWREMAKQVAHEIKNPLTPMKLNVQQLYKSWKDGAPGFEKKLERFTKNQIEYIENLSSIASAFSSFAKMPGAKPVEVDLLEQIKTTLELFKNTGRMTFRVNWPHENKIFVYADKEHLNGIFSNLIKNGIQSIPAGRDGTIKIGLDLKEDKVIVSISDNGTGIPDNLKKNLFIPNFTTKSSGMGLGLSIVKRYVEGANGRVWFESEINKGTVFYIEFPLIYTVEKLG
jgi:two-component system, NtrC family, nitrogen regulation sensor histidine kinase NtrY